MSTKTPAKHDKFTDRRKFLAGLALGAGVAPLAALLPRRLDAGQAPSANASLCYSQSKPLLTPQNFSYLGYYDVQLNGPNSTYGQALTHRYVNGDLRLLHHSGGLSEFSLSGKSYGQLITTKTNSWALGALLPSGTLRSFNGFWFDEATQRLWFTGTVDYTATNYPARIHRVGLGSNGTVNNYHMVTLGTLPAKRVYGGVQPIPASLRPQFGGHAYVCGWGGYTSLMNQGGSCSLGPALYAFPDPSMFGHNAVIPDASVLRIMDTSGSTKRGVRKTLPINYYDGGDPRQNPSTPPTSPPLSTAQWLSPNSQGLGWMVWGDSYYNTGMWIETPTRSGLVAIASLGGGKNYYMSSTLHSDYRQFEWHIFDPATMAATGRPASMTPFTVHGFGTLGGPGNTGNSPAGNLNGATFDPVTQRIYVMGCAPSDNISLARLAVYAVTP